MEFMFDLTGKTALVTGGTRGIGRAMTMAIAEAGADIILVQHDRSNESVLIAVHSLGRGCIIVEADLANAASVASIMPRLEELQAALPNGGVNAIAPGYVATDVNAELLADAVCNMQILERIPAARWRRPEDFAGPAMFLASDRASGYVAGETLVVDGGWMAR